LVAIKNHEADKLIERPPDYLFAYLIHGKDHGLIWERANKLFKYYLSDQDPTFSSVRLSGDDLAQDQGRLADEAYSIGLFGGRRVLFVEAGSKSFIPSLEVLFDSPPKDSILIIQAGELKRDSALRSLFEKSKLAASVECYPDSAADLNRLIVSEAKKYNLSITEDDRSELISLLGSDRAATRSELEKLFLYAHGTEQITQSDIYTIVADASAVAIDAAISNAYCGNIAAVSEIIPRALETGLDGGTLLTFALSHGLNLHKAMSAIASGVARESALSSVMGGNRSPQARQSVELQVKLWTLQKLSRSIDNTADAIKRSRSQGALDTIIAMRAYWSIAQAAKARS
jgi:DNA polymerase-3 subunit delta